MRGIPKVVFPVWALLALVVGAPLLIAPGRFLAIFGWQPVEPILDRILGAALLALSWAAWRAWRTSDRAAAVLVIEVEAAFSALAAVGVLRHLLTPAYYPLMVWVVFVVLAVFAIVWLSAMVISRARR